MKKLITTVFIFLIATTSYAQTFIVERVIDGDSIVVKYSENKTEEIQLIGVNAPNIVFPEGVDRTLMDPSTESVEEAQAWGIDLDRLDKMGREAAEFVKSLGLEGKEVRLEFDVQERDKYGRLLAYVWYTIYRDDVRPEYLYFQTVRKNIDENVFGHSILNATIIKAGYAQPMTIPPNVKYADLFQKLYEEPREQKRGLWKNTLNEKYLGSMLYCEQDEDCSLRDGACGPEPMNIYFDNSKLIEMQPYVECADYVPLMNPRCENGKCVADKANENKRGLSANKFSDDESILREFNSKPGPVAIPMH